MLNSLVQSAVSATLSANQKPSPVQVIQALLDAEKTVKKTKPCYTFAQLIGTWRLYFVTGTQKKRHQPGITLGNGKYLPRWLNITLRYALIDQNTLSPDQGQVENCVQFAAIQLILSGPIKFLSQKSLLVFDFTRMTVKWGQINFYSGYIRGGKKAEESFYLDNVSKQAFFAYFIIETTAIAARGKGGGLALWGRVEEDEEQVN